MKDGLTRRQFVRNAAAVSVGCTVGLTPVAGCHPSTGSGPLEGIYTDRFTYRHGDVVNVHLSVKDPSPLFVDILRHDLPQSIRVLRMEVQPQDIQNLTGQGWNAGFAVAASFAASELAPGYYEARIAAESLLEANRVNAFNGFPSINNVARFVVSDAIPGSRLRILFIHDSLTGTCYGSFGELSIYGTGPVFARIVSTRRPGLDRATAGQHFPLRVLRNAGYEPEFIDLKALSNESPGFLDNYDLVLLFGQFEYITHEVMAHLDRYLANGGGLFIASEEFATFRVRMWGTLLETYKYDAAELDPFVGGPDPARVAGIGMHQLEGLLETEIAGQTVWAAHDVSPGTFIDFPLFNTSQVGWILEGTGLGSGDVLPGAFREIASGNFAVFENGQPRIVESELTRTAPGTIIWGALPSENARAWWQVTGGDQGAWPRFSGHALATLQQRESGAIVVTLPSSFFVAWHHGDPIYERLLLNIVDRMLNRSY